MKRHLRVDAEAYDVQIRRLIPHYDEMIATGVELLAALAPADSHVLDLGGGTGALSSAVLAALPGARVTVLDVDPDMLVEARRRLAGLEIGFRFSRQAFWIRCRRQTRSSLRWRFTMSMISRPRRRCTGRYTTRCRRRGVVEPRRRGDRGPETERDWCLIGWPSGWASTGSVTRKRAGISRRGPRRTAISRWTSSLGRCARQDLTRSSASGGAG